MRLKMLIEYSFPKIGNLLDLKSTNDRETAKRCIERGYKLFTVPQMFGLENGQIILYLEDQNQKASRMSKAAAAKVLSDFETSSQQMYTSQSAL